MICLKITSTLQPQSPTVLFAVENDSNRCSKCLLSHNFCFSIKYDLAAIRAWEKKIYLCKLLSVFCLFCIFAPNYHQ